ncbi:MAG: HAMP domain-containing histidine kinase [Gammaproteobacteria bacterium]|jgi:signal transduction histidine kinase|nr:HAMP domain-containing histidine kinase [Gammaproteobacteria bacterium]MBT3858590.1 HAMP domain-containing histidine kinase [Gammaproteobacteria bacterium]MBT3986672.1 HAMP domain-containing histidine kinase [Gammaproteobacteria bacterium]MBT4254976.1 HAMP domain-containing histidine kinase [Gammaproteobacteria bacterium]MBT4582768.1 HAMP domain-containing histidine kinase [Gammaproteobacteria bacterium]
MTTLVHRVQRSLFFRLSLIFGITVVLFFVIISLSLRSMNQSDDVIESIPDFFTRNIESIIEDIGTPPNLSNAMRLADELDWSIRIHNPIMQWSSDSDYRLDVEESEFTERLSGDAEMRNVNSEDIILVQRGGYDFYLYQRFGNENLFSAVSIYVGLALAALVLFLNYFMVNKLLNPVRLLRRGAERIRRGDLSFRVKSNRQDELGELTESINHMADSLQSMLEAKRQLLLAISHELRTPITKAKLRLEFMPESIEKEQLREDIDEIELLISDLIEAERLNDEHSVLVTEPVPFAEYIDSVMEPFKNYAGGLSFEQAEPDREFLIDKLRIRLLMTNLLNNGIRHGENNPILVKVSFEEENAILEVRDQGEGIEEKHLSQISEPFYRADSSRQRNTGGFGLGLYLCRLIAAAHGGELKIESELGEGTHITVRIPQHPPRLEPEPEWNDS